MGNIIWRNRSTNKDSKQKQEVSENRKDESDGQDIQKPEENELDVTEEIKIKWEKEQRALKEKLVIEDRTGWAKCRDPQHTVEPLKYIGGVDISFVKGDNVNACAALIVVNFPKLEVVYEDCAMVKLTAPYIPGFLAFREVDFLVERVQKLKEQAPEFMPQVIMVDGNGILHPREFGQACHLGVLLNLPALGVAKQLFQVDGLEKNAQHLGKIKQLHKGGDTFPLVGDSGRTLGMALRSCDSTTNPVYVSAGHMISLEASVWLVQQCCNYRIPEPVRQADICSREYLRENFKPEQN